MACLVYWPICLFVPVGVALIVRKQGIANVPIAVLAFGAFMSLGMGLMGYLGLAQYSLFRVHEGGVSQRAWGRTRTLLFEEVERFFIGGGHTYARGAYLGPSYSLAFYPTVDSGKRPLFVELPSFNFNSPQLYSDIELEGLRNWMYQTWSERMRKQLDAGHAVDWTTHLRFLPEGLEYRSKGTAGDGSEVIPYLSVSNFLFDWQRGKLSIFVGADAQPRIVEKLVRQPNDVPGLILLDGLRRHGAGEARQGSWPNGEGKP
jgi:hypothetical protein